jgi:hypothetical protein
LFGPRDQVLAQTLQPYRGKSAWQMTGAGAKQAAEKLAVGVDIEPFLQFAEQHFLRPNVKGTGFSPYI